MNLLKQHKKNIGVLVKILVSTILFFLIYQSVDINLVIENIKIMNLNYIFLVILLIILNYIVSSIRWKYLILHAEPKDINIPFLTKLYFVGSFFNNFMPTSMGGDVYKVYALSKKINSKTNAFTATFTERFTGMIALVLISYLGLIQTMSFWLAFLPSQLLDNQLVVNFFKFSLFFGFWFASFVFFYLLKILSSKIKFVSKIYSSFLNYKHHKNLVLNALLTSFVVQFFAILSQYFVFSALNIELPVFYSLAVLPVITLAGFFIPSLNGVGVQDALYIQFFTLVGVSPEIAVTASIMYHFCRLVVSLIGGILYAIEKN